MWRKCGEHAKKMRRKCGEHAKKMWRKWGKKEKRQREEARGESEGFACRKLREKERGNIPIPRKGGENVEKKRRKLRKCEEEVRGGKNGEN